MSQLTICIPSKRGYDDSRRTIEEALAFAEARHAEIVLSDNSADPVKEGKWRNHSPRLRYLPSAAPTALDNFLFSLKAAETPFVLLLGDDDGIGFDPTIPAVDLATLPADFMGVRPRTQVFVTGHGVYREKTFGIEAETPAARIREYSVKAEGDNSAFYSLFRREPLVDLLEFFLTRHPIRAEFVDWALSLALFAYGRMAYDPGIIYRYNADQWSSADRIKTKNAELFAAAGLPPHTTLFQPLLMALDLFVFVARPGTPLSREGALDAIGIVAGDFMNGFVNQVIREPLKFTDRMRYLAELAQQERDAFGRFQLGLVMVDDLKPGLKDAYLEFYKSSMQAR